LTALKGVAGVTLGAVAGVVAWIVMILVTSGVCSVPVLSTLWCTIGPGSGGSLSLTITLWDMVLLIGFGGAGGYMGARMAMGLES
jgi:hypothetical protein